MGPESSAAPPPTALVTGGSRGIGAATCLALASRGWDVAFTYRNKAARAAEVADRIRSGGTRALPVQADITDPDAVRVLLRTPSRAGLLRSISSCSAPQAAWSGTSPRRTRTTPWSSTATLSCWSSIARCRSCGPARASFT
ncbi:MAG: SDR family NAD(P)-dependent oxidoreductase [Candidatus Limnocylindria bacterium]